MRRPAVVLAILVALGAAARAAGGLQIVTPWIAPDEMTYGLLGRGLWEHGRLEVLGGPSPFYSFLYPALAGLPPRVFGRDTGYDVLRVVQALVMCSTAIVVYAWARSLTRARWALVAAALVLALPALVYSGMLLTDVLFLPLATLAAWLAVRALGRPIVGRQAAFLAALAACALTRLEANVIAIAFLVAAIPLRRVRVLWPTWAVLGAGVVVWIGLHAGSPSSALGGYRSATGSYDVLSMAEYVVYHAGTIVLVTGVVPVCAVAILAASRPVEERLRASLAMIVALTAVTVLEVGVFASRNTHHLTERTLMFALPPLLVGFAVWLDRGLPRPRRLALVVAACAVALVAALPLGRVARQVAIPDAPSLVPLIHLGGTSARLGATGVALAGAALFLFLPRRFSLVLPVALFALLAAVSVSAAREYTRQSRATQVQLLGPDARWIDRATTKPVAYLYDGGAYWNIVWTQAYANERIARVIDLAGTSVPGPLPQSPLKLLPASGELRPHGGGTLGSPLIVASRWVTFRGSPVASTTLPTADTPGLTLWRLDDPARIDSTTTGMLPNGDVYSRATLTVYDCRAGTFVLTAFGKGDGKATLEQDGAAIRSRDVARDEAWRESIPVPAGPPRICTFAISTTAPLGTTQFRFIRSG